MCKNVIRKYRKQKGYTLEELSEKVGITASYLCHLEKGTRTNPSTRIMRRIAEALDIGVTEIFFE